MAVLGGTSSAVFPFLLDPVAPVARELFRLPQIPYQRLRFTLEAREPARLSAYHGSMLRGAFGHALRRAVCAFGPDQPCESCTLRRACTYTRLFEVFIEGEPPPFLRGLPTGPRPYVIEPLAADRDVPAGGTIDFDLVLIGQAIDLAPYAVLAVERMACGGLGSGRHRFALAKVCHLAAAGAWSELPAADPAVRSLPRILVEEGAAEVPSRVRVHFSTPTRIKVRGHLVPSVTARGLVFAMLRRTLELAHFHVPGAQVDWTIRPLLDHASDVRVVGSDLRWHDWERYSNRQRTRMTLGGFVGTLDLEGDLAPLWMLLRTAEVLHVGKGTTFGLGKLRLCEVPR